MGHRAREDPHHDFPFLYYFFFQVMRNGRELADFIHRDSHTYFYCVFIISFSMLDMEPRTSYMLGKLSAAEPHPSLQRIFDTSIKHHSADTPGVSRGLTHQLGIARGNLY